MLVEAKRQRILNTIRSPGAEVKEIVQLLDSLFPLHQRPTPTASPASSSPTSSSSSFSSTLAAAHRNVRDSFFQYFPELESAPTSSDALNARTMQAGTCLQKYSYSRFQTTAFEHLRLMEQLFCSPFETRVPVMMSRNAIETQLANKQEAEKGRKKKAAVAVEKRATEGRTREVSFLSPKAKTVRTATSSKATQSSTKTRTEKQHTGNNQEKQQRREEILALIAEVQATSRFSNHDFVFLCLSCLRHVLVLCMAVV